MTVVNPKSITGVTSITTPSGSDNLFTVHTNNTTERVRINNDGDVIVGSGITVSPDGDIFATGVCTATSFSGSGANLTGIVAIPSGGIILWSGAADAIPSGFVLCDGNNSTPNLSGKFVVGYSASDSDFDVGDTGGAKTDSVSISVSGTTGSNNSFSNGSGSSNARIYRRSDGGVHTHSFSGSGSATVDTLPPYYALCYIMKT